jgi:CheY-like chemotaxis protein
MSVVLIVDDDVMFRAVLASALESQGHTVLQAGDGRSALGMLNSQHIDLVITDIVMPGTDGIEMIMDLRAAKSAVPIIAMTGHHPMSDIYLKVAKSLGAHGVVSKPFKMATLIGIVEELFQKRV